MRAAAHFLGPAQRKDLAIGDSKTTHVRREMSAADDAEFDAAWADKSSRLPRPLSLADSSPSGVKSIADKH